MDYLWFKLPIYFILFVKTRQISKMHASLMEHKALTASENSILMIFISLYAGVFVLLLAS